MAMPGQNSLKLGDVGGANPQVEHRGAVSSDASRHLIQTARICSISSEHAFLVGHGVTVD
jgi:hypothetical protein